MHRLIMTMCYELSMNLRSLLVVGLICCCCSIISLVQRQVCLGKHDVLEVTWLSRDSSEQFVMASWGENKKTVVQLLSPD